MEVQVTQIGTPPLVFHKNILLKFITMKNGLKNLGQATRDRMRQTIETEKHRKAGSKGTLEKAINYYVDDLPNNYTVGIGLVSELNVKAPYWYIVNYGGWALPPGTEIWGHFGEYGVPDPAKAGTGVGRESFTIGTFPLYKMTVRHPIWAMNYIEKTANWLATVVKIHFYGWTKQTKISTFVRK